MNLEQFRIAMNQWGRDQVPFFFMVDFELTKPALWRIDDIDDGEILFDFNGVSNTKYESGTLRSAELITQPITLQGYRYKFDHVMQHLRFGNSFLVNLTIKTPIQFGGTLRDLFFQANAQYKLYWKNRFLCFSPERFVRIQNGKIYSYPMKGTINGEVPNAAQVILSSAKELAEHTTIVDLIRNDISSVAQQVSVPRFRYVENVRSGNKTLLQVSSEVVGILADGYLSHLGDVMVRLLPAGSVSGAPKEKTLQIIKEVEREARGYYAGIAGYFDGQALDSAVLIRYIDQVGDQYFYRSGGGITTQSECYSEYQEALDKIYVPVY
jgi:para-aminobenzoate synthetase component 1